MKNKIRINASFSVESRLTENSPLKFNGSDGKPFFKREYLLSDNEHSDNRYNTEEEAHISTVNDQYLDDFPDLETNPESSESEYEPVNKAALAVKIIPSLLVCTGTACAMLPVFNYLVRNSEELGIDVHNNEALFITSTVNTFIVTALSSYSNMHQYIKKYQHDELKQNNPLKIICKIGAGFSVILPIGLLWGVEIHDQKVSGSKGFDEFIAWATFTTIPLLINNTVESIRTVDKFVENKGDKIELNSVGSKFVVYGLGALSVAGRAIAYTQAAKTLCEIMGMDDNVSLGIGIAAGGIIGSSGIALFEYEAVRSLFAEQRHPFTIKKLLGGLCSVAEGAWFSLPTLSLGLKFAEDWNPLLKGMLFTPVVLSSTTYGASKLYDNISSSYDSLTGFCSQYYPFKSSEVEPIGVDYAYNE